MNRNHKQMAGANEYPTLSVPKRWTLKRMINMPIEMKTTASAKPINTHIMFSIGCNNIFVHTRRQKKEIVFYLYSEA